MDGGEKEELFPFLQGSRLGPIHQGTQQQKYCRINRGCTLLFQSLKKKKKESSRLLPNETADRWL